MSRGVPFDVAFNLQSEDTLVWTVILGEIDGGEFDWNSMSWKDRK